MNDVVNGFNNVFVSIGPRLAEEIENPKIVIGEVQAMDFLDNNPNSMYLKLTDEKEIIEIVSKWKNKKSTDWNDIEMALIKEIIDAIVKPLTYICNLSFKTGVFPSKMKIAKVIPLYKAGEREINLLIIGHCLYSLGSLKYWKNCMLIDWKTLWRSMNC